jgi:hypothetical protein
LDYQKYKNKVGNKGRDTLMCLYLDVESNNFTVEFKLELQNGGARHLHTGSGMRGVDGRDLNSGCPIVSSFLSNSPLRYPETILSISSDVETPGVRLVGIKRP